MARFNNYDGTEENNNIEGAENLSFHSIPVGDLSSAEYTLVDIAIDHSGSIQGYEGDLMRMLQKCVQACKKTNRAENIMLRVTIFSGNVGIRELHGYLPLNEISEDNYQPFTPDGGTPLYDATFSAIASMGQYGRQLRDQNLSCNGIAFIITDGEEGGSVEANPNMIRERISTIDMEEWLESLISIVIGVGSARIGSFAEASGLTHTLNMGQVNEAMLSDLAQVVSGSIVSQSQAMGTGKGADLDNDMSAFI